MKDLMTTKNLMYVGIGLVTAYVLYRVLVNRETTPANPVTKAVDSTDDTSDFCGCGA